MCSDMVEVEREMVEEETYSSTEEMETSLGEEVMYNGMEVAGREMVEEGTYNNMEEEEIFLEKEVMHNDMMAKKETYNSTMEEGKHKHKIYQRPH